MAEHRHPWVRRVLGLGVLAGLAYAVWRAIEQSSEARDKGGWEPQPFPFPPQPRADGDAANRAERGELASEAWLEADGDACPASHPVKGKLKSGIYHVPGGLSYDRTTPDRCYVDERAAEADGLRAAKR